MHSHCGALLSLFILFSEQLNAAIKANGTQLLDSLITWNADGSSGKQSDTDTHTHACKHASMHCSGIPREKTVLKKNLYLIYLFYLFNGWFQEFWSNSSHEERQGKKQLCGRMCVFAVHMTTECTTHHVIHIFSFWRESLSFSTDLCKLQAEHKKILSSRL